MLLIGRLAPCATGILIEGNNVLEASAHPATAGDRESALVPRLTTTA